MSLTAGASHATQETASPVVVTRGRGVVRAAPDQARVTVAAESRATSPREAQQRTATAMVAVQSALEDGGVPADAITTLSFQLQPEFDYQNGQRRLLGYLARNTIEVRLDEIDRVGAVLDLVTRAGATSVTGVRFDVRERADLEREALRLAVGDARARAEAAAAGAGRSIAEVQRIEEHGAAVPEPRPVVMAMRAQSAAAETPIAPGEIEVVAAVTLTATLR